MAVAIKNEMVERKKSGSTYKRKTSTAQSVKVVKQQLCVLVSQETSVATYSHHICIIIVYCRGALWYLVCNMVVTCKTDQY